MYTVYNKRWQRLLTLLRIQTKKGVYLVEGLQLNKVLEQIKKDVEAGDVTAIEILLQEVSEKSLLAFLQEELI